MKKYILLFVALLAGMSVCAEDYITDVMLIGGTQSEVNLLKDLYTEQGWTVINKDLNKGCGSSSDYIYLLYKNLSDSIGHNFVTDFVISTVEGKVANTFIKNGCTYYLVPYDGGEHFKSVQGDLNSNCRSGSANLHLYYTTTEKDDRCCIITSINFNNKKDGAVVDDNSNFCDFNDGAGGDYIYMHTDKTQGWNVYMNSSRTQCYITGLDGPKEFIKSVVIPTSVDSAEVLYVKDPVFSEFTNLETMDFHDACIFDRMPSLRGCSKFKRVGTSERNSQFAINEQFMIPFSIKTIPHYAFAGTAIEKIEIPSQIEIESFAFDGCDSLKEVSLLNADIIINSYAFANIKGMGSVKIRGRLNDLDPSIFIYSPNLYLAEFRPGEGDLWACGWCGGDNEESHNNLYWIFEQNQLKINCYSNVWEDHPQEQVINTKTWERVFGILRINKITIEHVDSIRNREFYNFPNLETVDIVSGLRSIGDSAVVACPKLKRVNLPSCLKSIGAYAFLDCNSLTDIYFDGSHEQWTREVAKGDGWKPDTTTVHWHCTVTFNSNGHGTAPDPQSIEWSNQDQAAMPTAPSANGYNFTGWYTEAACTNRWNFDNVIPGDMTLYAGWQKIYLPGDVDGSGVVDGNDLNMLINILLGKLAPTDDSVKGNPNVDGEGGIDGNDLNTLINILLGKQ